MQHGVARIMNLANGEFLVLGALAAFWIFVADSISPVLTMLIVAPLSFFGNWLIYRRFYVLLCAGEESGPA